MGVRSRRPRARRIRSFAAVGAADARWLVLGSMPGNASLAAMEYYAHPRNAFWRIMERLHGIPCGAPYPARLAALEQAGIAVWDVLMSCRRESSLDSDIDRRTARPNDLGDFLSRHPQVHTLCFNGAPARQLFERLAVPRLTADQRAITRLTLPSTSPANARLTFEQKLAAWAVLGKPTAASGQ